MPVLQRSNNLHYLEDLIPNHTGVTQNFEDNQFYFTSKFSPVMVLFVISQVEVIL